MLAGLLCVWCIELVLLFRDKEGMMLAKTAGPAKLVVGGWSHVPWEADDVGSWQLMLVALGPWEHD